MIVRGFFDEAGTPRVESEYKGKTESLNSVARHGAQVYACLDPSFEYEDYLMFYQTVFYFDRPWVLIAKPSKMLGRALEVEGVGGYFGDTCEHLLEDFPPEAWVVPHEDVDTEFRDIPILSAPCEFDYGTGERLS